MSEPSSPKPKRKPLTEEQKELRRAKNRRWRAKADAQPVNPSVWTASVEAKLFQALELGCPIGTSCWFAGVPKRAYLERVQRGEAADSGPDWEFVQRVHQSRAKARVRLVAIISKASEKQWTAAAWLLERSDPDEWGKKDSVVVLQKLAADVDKLSDADLLALATRNSD